MRQLIVTLVIILFNVSCSRNSNDLWYIIDEFPPPVELHGKRILENEFGILWIYSINSHIITSTIRDTLFHVYDKKYEYLGGFGQRGHGPYEFPEIGVIIDIIVHDERIIVFAIDPARYKIYGIDLISTLESNEIIILYDYELPWDLHGAAFSYQIEKNTVVGTYQDHFHQRLDGKYGLFYYYPESDSIEILPLYNLDIYLKGGQQINDPIARMNVNAHVSTISPDRSKFAVQLFLTPRLEIFTIGDPHPTSRMFT